MLSRRKFTAIVSTLPFVGVLQPCDFSWTDEFIKEARKGLIRNKTFKLDKPIIMESGWDIKRCHFKVTNNFRGNVMLHIPKETGKSRLTHCYFEGNNILGCLSY